MKQEKVSALLAETLEQDIDRSVNLWPAIRARAGAPARAARRSPRIAWSVGIALVALLGAAGVAIALSIQEKAASVDDGINAVYKGKMVTPVNQTQTIDGVTVTLDWVYADPLRVLVAYTTEAGNRKDFRPGTSLSSDSLLNGLKVEPVGGVGYVENNTHTSEISALIAPDLPEGAASIDAQLALRVTDDSALLNATDMPAGAADSPDAKQAQLALIKDLGTLNFKVQIPVTPGHVFAPNQQAEASGVTVTLKRLIVAPSGVRADLCFAPPADGEFDWTIVGRVQGSGKNTDGAIQSSSKMAGEQSCEPVFFFASLPMDASSYTVTMTEVIGLPTAVPDSQQVRIKGPWVFTVDNH